MWDDNESAAHKHVKHTHTPKRHCGIWTQRNYSMKHDVLAADGADGPIECCWVHLWVHLVWQGTKAAESGFLIEDTEPKIKIMHMVWPIGQHRKVHNGHRIPSGCVTHRFQDGLGGDLSIRYLLSVSVLEQKLMATYYTHFQVFLFYPRL